MEFIKKSFEKLNFMKKEILNDYPWWLDNAFLEVNRFLKTNLEPEKLLKIEQLVYSDKLKNHPKAKILQQILTIINIQDPKLEKLEENVDKILSNPDVPKITKLNLVKYIAKYVIPYIENWTEIANNLSKKYTEKYYNFFEWINL